METNQSKTTPNPDGLIFLSDEAQPIAPSLTDSQRLIASETVARIVAETCDSHDKLGEEDLKALAVSAAKAMVAGFLAINGAT